MDALDQLVFNSDVFLAVAILGRGEDFVLAPVGPCADEAAKHRAAADAIECDFEYIGALAIDQGRPRAIPNPASVAGIGTMAFAAIAFAFQVGEQAQPKQGDAVEFLERLFALDDKRDTA